MKKFLEALSMVLLCSGCATTQSPLPVQTESAVAEVVTDETPPPIPLLPDVNVQTITLAGARRLDQPVTVTVNGMVFTFAWMGSDGYPYSNCTPVAEGYACSVFGT